MLQLSLTIQSIPAILWGAPSDKAYIFVHGRQSCKEDAESFSRIATHKGYQVLSFDLPGHGVRQAEGYRLTVLNAVHDLQVVADFAATKWSHLSLFASSLGAYFSLVVYPELQFAKCLFQSPILDMENVINSMMKSASVSEELLKEMQEIPTSMGETLSWPYYTFVKAHPIEKWQSPTYILYASGDNLTPGYIVDAFVAKFHCQLELLQNGEHYFHTKAQLLFLDRWLQANI